MHPCQSLLVELESKVQFCWHYLPFWLLLQVALRDRTRLLTAQQKETGAWLSAPHFSLGLRLCDDSLLIAVGLRLNSPLCTPHLCPHCETHINTSGVHALSCRSIKGRLPRYTALNSIIHKALMSANIPSNLEPWGSCMSDGKRLDGLTITPWSI